MLTKLIDRPRTYLGLLSIAPNSPPKYSKDTGVAFVVRTLGIPLSDIGCDDVIGIQLCAVVELDPFAQVKSPLGQFLVSGPLFCQTRHNFNAADLVGQQRFVDLLARRVVFRHRSRHRTRD